MVLPISWLGFANPPKMEMFSLPPTSLHSFFSYISVPYPVKLNSAELSGDSWRNKMSSFWTSVKQQVLLWFQHQHRVNSQNLKCGWDFHSNHLGVKSFPNSLHTVTSTSFWTLSHLIVTTLRCAGLRRQGTWVWHWDIRRTRPSLTQMALQGLVQAQVVFALDSLLSGLPACVIAHYFAHYCILFYWFNKMPLSLATIL